MGSLLDYVRGTVGTGEDFSVEGALKSAADKLGFGESADDKRIRESQEAAAAAQKAKVEPQDPATALIQAAPLPFHFKDGPPPASASLSAPVPDPVVVDQPKPTAKKSSARVSVSAPTESMGAAPFTSLASMGPKAAEKDAVEGTATNKAPEPTQAEKDATELKALQARADREGNWNELGSLLSQNAALIRGHPEQYNDASFARGAQQARQGVKDFEERKAAARQSVQDDAQAFQAKQLRDSLDPNSDMSKRATMLAKATGLVPPSYDGPLTASMWSDMKDGATLGQAKQNHADTLAQADRELAFKGKEGEANRKNALQLERERTAGEYRLHQMETAAKGAKSNDAQEVSPGWTTTPGIRLKDEEAAKFRGGVAAQRDLEATAAELKALVQKHGTEQMPGPAKTRMQSLVAKLKVQAKNIDQLGALSGSDYKLLDDQVPDPTAWTSMSSENALTGLDQLVGNGRDTVRSSASSLGIKSRPAAAPQKSVDGKNYVFTDGAWHEVG